MITFFQTSIHRSSHGANQYNQYFVEIESHMDIILSRKTTIIINFDLLLKWAGYKALITEKR